MHEYVSATLTGRYKEEDPSGLHLGRASFSWSEETFVPQFILYSSTCLGIDLKLAWAPVTYTPNTFWISYTLLFHGFGILFTKNITSEN